MKNKSYLNNRRKKSFASIILALLLMISFNASPLMFLSSEFRNANAYKSSQTRTYYSSESTDSDGKFNDATYPSSLKNYFEGSSKTFNIFSEYNTRFDEIYKKLADEFFENYNGAYFGSGSSTSDYNTYYQTFLDTFGAESLSDFYTKQKDSDLLKLKLETVSFLNLAELLGTKGIENYDDAKSKSIPAISTVAAGSFKKLSDFYRLLANYSIDGNINSNPMDGDDSPNNDITTSEAFYNSNTHYKRLKEFIDNEIAKEFPISAFDGTTQDTNIAAIFADLVPSSIEYNYVTNSYETYSEPSANYRTSTVSDKTNKNIYYFGDESDISGTAAYTAFGDFFICKTQTEKENDDMLFYRLIKNGEDGYIDSAHPTYYRYTSKPYVTKSSNYVVYVLNNNPTQNQLDTYSSIYFETMTQSEFDSESKYYVQIPYETDQLYFKAVYGNLLFSREGFTFEEFVDYFTTKVGSSERTSKLYLKYTASEKKKVFIDSSKLADFEAANPKYSYSLTGVDFSDSAIKKNDYEKITSNSSNSAYINSITGEFELYFMKTKEYYTESTTNNYSSSKYETKKNAIVDLEQEPIPTAGYITESGERKIFVVSEYTSVKIGSKSYEGVKQEEIDSNSKFFVEVPEYIYNKYSIDNTYKLYYKHTSTNANKIYVVDNSDGASDNKIYKTLNYNVISSTELENNFSNYLFIPETDANYNENFQIYYKYNRTQNPSAGIYVLETTGISTTGTNYKTVGDGELSDFILIDKSTTEGAAIYNTAISALSISVESEKLKLYYKLSDIFVQNELKGGNAIYIIDASLSTSDKEEYSRNMYTAISQKEVDNNPGLYVLIDDVDPNHSSKDGVKLYYRYKQSDTETRTVYSIEDIDQSESGFDKNAYELIPSDDDNYKAGKELYYKRVLESSTENHVNKNTYYYYQTSSTVTLSANSYYAISFYVQTIGDNARASFGIKDTANILTDLNLNNINTNGKWEQYFLFLSTDAATASSINLYLYLGDDENGVSGNTSQTSVSGAVFFDDIKITKIGLSDFNKRAIDDKAVYSTPYKEGEVEQDNKFADEYNNRVYVANDDDRFENSTSTLLNAFDSRKYIDNSIDVYGDTNKWKDIFDFDNTNLQNLLGKDNGVEADKIANRLSETLTANIDGYNMYDSSFTSLWRYYISRDLKNEFSIEKYRKAYSDGKLDVSITNKIEEPEEKKDEDKEEDTTEDEAEKSDIKYVSSPFKNDNYVLKLKNTNKDINLGITSNSFKVKQFEYYKITLWIYSPDLEGKATVSVNSVLKTRSNPVYGTLLSSSVSSTYANVENSGSKNSEFGWIPVTLYIEGNNYQDMDCYLVLTADKDCTVYFDNIRIEKTTSAQFDTAQSNSSSEKYTCALSLTPSSSLYSSDVKNGTFDYVKETSIDHDVTSDVPYTPDNWTGLSDNSSRVVAGVVSTQQTAFFDKYSKDTNKIPTDASDDFSNVYAIYSPATVKALDGTTNISYKHKYSIYSGSLSMSSNSVYQITFKFYKTDAFTGSMISNIYLSSVKNANIIASMEVSASEIESGWQTFTYYIATSTSSQTVYIEIGVKDSTELCFFKSVKSQKLTNKTINGLMASEAEKIGINSGASKNLYEAFTNIKFLDMSNTNFSYHSTKENENTNLFDQKVFSDKSDVTPDHTAGQIGVAVASYFDTNNTTTYSITISKTTYYIGEVYTFNVGETTYYVHKTYNQAANKFSYKIYSDSALKNEVEKINNEEFEIKTTGSVIVKVGETDYTTTTTYRLYKFADLRDEVTEISGSSVSVTNLNEVVVGSGSKATKNTITSTVNSSYTYHFNSSTKEDYVLNNTIIPASELDNEQSANVMILSNSYSTDYITMTQSSTRTLGTSTYNVLRIYVKTSNFAQENFGLNIEIEAVNVEWKNINTTNSKYADKYGFVCYEVLIRSNSSDSISSFGVKLSLGNETNTGTGYAIVSKISLDSLSSAEAFEHYSEVVGDDNETIKKAIYENKANDSDDDNEDADDKNSISWATFFYIFSSILLVVTIVIAMIAILLKKHPIKATQVFENEHDRDITSNTQNKKSASTTRKQIIIDGETEATKKENSSDGGIL